MLPEPSFLSELQARTPIALKPLSLVRTVGAGLVIVDEVHGFVTVGAGPLAPLAPNTQIDRMVEETASLARLFVQSKKPILAFLDTHPPGKAEPPYPPHCEIGSGEEDLVPALAWLEEEPLATLVRKDCINGFIGAIEENGRNIVLDWIRNCQLTTLVVTGICTDICVMDFVLTLLSARNHGMAGPLQSIWVYEPACATYDMNAEAAARLGLPETALHPQAVTHHMGLYFMAARGAQLASEIILD